ENGAITPTFNVSPVAPAIFLLPPPDPQAASTAPERLIAAAEPTPALVAHSMNVRREMSLLTCRSMKSRPCSGFMSPKSLLTAGCCVIKCDAGNHRMPRTSGRGNACLPVLVRSDGRIPRRTFRRLDALLASLG